MVTTLSGPMLAAVAQTRYGARRPVPRFKRSCADAVARLPFKLNPVVAPIILGFVVIKRRPVLTAAHRNCVLVAQPLWPAALQYSPADLKRCCAP